MPLTDTRETRDFAREVKFLVDAPTGHAIREWVRARFAPDPHGSGMFGDEYRTTSLYFDTANLDVFHRRGSFGRSKYRIRRYGAGEEVFLERKLRNPYMLTKRRTIVPLGALARLEGDPIDRWAGHWFQQRLRARQLEPACHLSYHRTARVAMTPQGPARITLDDGLRAAPATGMAFRGESGSHALNGHVIVEMKFRHDMPVVFKHLIEHFKLNSRALSKYRIGVMKLGRATDPAMEIRAATGRLEPICA